MKKSFIQRFVLSLVLVVVVGIRQISSLVYNAASGFSPGILLSEQPTL